jgi:hypothetical protein
VSDATAPLTGRRFHFRSLEEKKWLTAKTAKRAKPDFSGFGKSKKTLAALAPLAVQKLLVR